MFRGDACFVVPKVSDARKGAEPPAEAWTWVEPTQQRLATMLEMETTLSQCWIQLQIQWNSGSKLQRFEQKTKKDKVSANYLFITVVPPSYITETPELMGGKQAIINRVQCPVTAGKHFETRSICPW